MTQAGKQMYLVANWKSYKSLPEAYEFIDSLTLPALPPTVDVILCPPFPYLFPIAERIKERQLALTLGSQDISRFPFGAYTGAVTGEMIHPITKYTIVGHSERRNYFHETNQEVGNKARIALDAGLTPIVCIDEPYLESQLAFFTPEELTRVIVAYEPLAAIGSGIPDTPEHAGEIAEKIIKHAQTDIPVLYGGSVTAETVASFMAIPVIQGVLVGGASLKGESWSSLVKAAIE